MVLGAAFLMATSAIGPGFLTQTVVFTERLGASFGFVILASIVIDIVAQANVWRVLVASGRRAQDVANLVLPRLGYFLALLVALGGLVFNVGNVAGAGLGLNALLGISPAAGAAATAVLATGIFLVREAGRAMDRFATGMGGLLILLTLYVAFSSRPPVGEALVRTILPARLDPLAIVTIVGGTVGGYIMFSGGHRLLDGGLRGIESVPRAMRGAVTGITVASLMRALLFLAALGVVAGGAVLDPANPPAAVFQHAAGAAGYRVFGLVMWAAAITSVVGASYTSVSFVRTLSPVLDRRHRELVIAFIVISAAVFLTVGRPVRVLILAGALNGLILPVALGVMLVAAHRRDITGALRPAPWLTGPGIMVVLVMAVLGAVSLVRDVPRLWSS